MHLLWVVQFMFSATVISTLHILMPFVAKLSLSVCCLLLFLSDSCAFLSLSVYRTFPFICLINTDLPFFLRKTNPETEINAKFLPSKKEPGLTMCYFSIEMLSTKVPSYRPLIFCKEGHIWDHFLLVLLLRDAMLNQTWLLAPAGWFLITLISSGSFRLQSVKQTDN